MKKLKKIIILMLSLVVAVFCFAGCNAGTNELESKLDRLQSQLEEANAKLSEMERLQDELTEMNDRLSETERLQDELTEMNDRLSETEKQMQQLQNELAEQSSGTLYTLQKAYGNGWLTQEDLMCIAYYHNGGRKFNEDIISEDYAPAPKTPEVLSGLTELKIKNAAANYYKENYDIKEIKAEDFTTEYCGTYGDCIAVCIEDNLGGAAVAQTVSVAGVNIFFGTAQLIPIGIWRDTK